MVLLVGAGCNGSNSGNTATSTDSATSTHDVVKKPGGVEPLDYAIEACEHSGYDVILKYDNETKTTDTYCQFNSGYACEAVSYITGTCTTTSTNRMYLVTTNGMPQNIRTCSNEEQPVCGKDGITYMNSCIAGLQQIAIQHQGVCSIEEQQASSGSDSTNKTGGTTGGSTQTTGSSKSDIPSWWGYIPSIIGYSGRQTATKEICTYEGNAIVYFVEDNCPECFSTLYNKSGSVLCHPSNDIANSCPNFFKKDSRSAYCKKM